MCRQLFPESLDGDDDDEEDLNGLQGGTLALLDAELEAEEEEAVVEGPSET